jgi:hypothetical protein
MPSLTRHPADTMSRLLARIGCLALLLSMFLVTPAGATAPQVTLTVVNQSDVEICYLFAAPAGRDDWGVDRLGSSATLAPGDSFAVRVAAGKYDIRAEGCDGSVLAEVRGADLSKDRTWHITGDNRAAGTETPRVTPTAALDNAEVTPAATAMSLVVLDQLLCCGQSVGGTMIWSIRYPRGWEVEYFGTQRQFLGAAIYDPAGSIRITLIPSGQPEAGSPMDTGEIESALDGLVKVRQGEEPGFAEFMREPVQGVLDTRLWGGTWPGRDERMWETYIVSIGELPYVGPMLPHTFMSLMGVRAASSDWAASVKIYEDMLATAQFKSLKDNTEIDGTAMGKPVVDAGMVRFCPKECAWEWISAAVEGWACPVYGEESSPYEVPCEP